MPEAFAAICEADYRVLGKRPYDVQIIAAAALHGGYLAEMNTGEGKTLSATMPLYLNALTGKSCMLVTTNEYLGSAKFTARFYGKDDKKLELKSQDASVNLAGNILPFEKEVYSEDAMEGIYVPGNAKAETIKEAEAAGVSGTNTSISGGLDMGSQIVAGAANSVINATKSAASKNIRKIKVTIKTNYRILLKDAKK